MIGFLSFGFDLRNTISGFQDGNKELSDSSCVSQGINPNDPPDFGEYGCSYEVESNVIWMGRTST